MDKLRKLIEKYLLGRKKWQDRDDVLYTDLQRFEDKLTSDETLELLSTLEASLITELKTASVIDYKAVTEKPSTYPLGTSVMKSEDQEGWPSGKYSVVATQKSTETRVVQYNYPKDPSEGTIFVRGLNQTLSNTWSDWVEVATEKSNVASASKLETARKIELTGGATGEVNFDGSKDVKITVKLTDGSHSHAMKDITGLIEALSAKVDRDYVVFSGTEAEWSALEKEEQEKYVLVALMEV